MKVFLSHSSIDKGFVETVVQQLRPGTYELDSMSFDAGVLNSQAIIQSLNRSDVFCLFLSDASLKSSYVDFETMLGIELFASGHISRMIVLCIDPGAFDALTESVKYFNVVRKSLNPDNAARLIQGYLIAATDSRQLQSHPFVGREQALLDLETQLTDHSRPLCRGIYVSGNAGSGRRTAVQKLYANLFPTSGKIFPKTNIDEYFGLEEIYRSVLSTLRPTIPLKELRTRLQAFAVASDEEKKRLIADLINSVLTVGEALMLVDRGGILSGSGQLAPEIDGIVDLLEAKPHPPAVIIANRMIPYKLRRTQNDVSYLALRALDREATNRLIRRLLRDVDVNVSEDDLDQLIDLCDGHPYNAYRMIDEVKECGLALFLANPSNFLEWKHRQSSEYLGTVELSTEQIQILALLKFIPELDFASFVDALSLTHAEASNAITELTYLHIVEPTSDRFLVSPALRIAVERDRRIALSADHRQSALKNLANALSIRVEEGSAPIALIDAAVLADLESGNVHSEFAAAFMLPSHNVRMSKRHYDDRNWVRSMYFAKEALKGRDRISSGGFVAACRYLCLSAARIGDAGEFNKAISRLRDRATDDWERSNVYFLEGFNLRLKGNLPRAEELFRRAYELTPRNMSAAREIAAICLVRENLDEAESFARQAFNYAPSNPYVVDILVSVLIKKYRGKEERKQEINDLFDKLEMVGNEAGRSFFATRKAEFEHLWGDNRLALEQIKSAVAKTPTIFEPQRLYAEILLKQGNMAKAYEVIQKMKGMVNARDPSERRTNYRGYLTTYARYLTEVELYEDAKEVFKDTESFTAEERSQGIREVEMVQGFKQTQ